MGLTDKESRALQSSLPKMISEGNALRAKVKKLRDALDTCKQFIEAADLDYREQEDRAMAIHCVKEARAALEGDG